jgi:hypothetical protein
MMTSSPFTVFHQRVCRLSWVPVACSPVIIRGTGDLRFIMRDKALIVLQLYTIAGRRVVARSLTILRLESWSGYSEVS